jgi:hypothetical protein
MSVTAVWREYNPATGNLIGTVSSFGFGYVNIGEFTGVKVIDVYVPSVSFISNVKVEIVSSPQIVVNAVPIDIRADGTAGNGNFGIELSENFVARETLSRFFAGENQKVTVGTRGGNVSKFIFLNIKMSMPKVGSGTVTYKVYFDYS